MIMKNQNIPIISFVVIALTSIVLILGLLFYEWSFISVFLIYWIENVVIGIFNVLRMQKVEFFSDSEQAIPITGELYTPNKRGKLISLFLIHYGFFVVGHGAGLLIICGFIKKMNLEEVYSLEVNLIALVIGVVGVLLTHVISYHRILSQGKKFRVRGLFFRPYKRVIILHLMVLAGSMIIMFNYAASMFGSTQQIGEITFGSVTLSVIKVILIFFIILKTVADLLFESRE